MKKEKRRQALELRKLGHSINEIKDLLGVSKASVSVWVRKIELTAKQKNELSKNGIKKSVIENRRQTRIDNEHAKRQVTVSAAQKQVKNISKHELWLIGTMLYWAEGGKTQRSIVRFSNGDPEMIKLMMAYFRQICSVPEEKIKGYIHIHEHLNHTQAEKYWSEISNIPLKNFYKTYKKTNPSSKNTRNTLPYGVMDIYICDTELFLKIQGWVQGIFSSY